MRRLLLPLACLGLACGRGVSPLPPEPVGPAPDAGSGATCTPGTRVFARAVNNARDLGGIPLAVGAVACGQLFRGAAPTAPAVCDAFAGAGVKTVIDLREDSERTWAPDAPCLLAQTQRLEAPLPIPYNLSPQNYLADFGTDASVRAVFATLGDDAAYPAYFHCTYGRDRTGVVAALVLLALGASRDEVMADYRRTAAAGMAIAPDSLTAVLDEVDTRGGIGAHLAAIGVTDAQLATLRARGRAP